jgi:NADPH:quinone reductase-like Zn-dependent oxidoreductase
LQIAKSLGATHLINYRTHPDWATEVLRITEGRGVDHVIDVAGAGTIMQSLRASRHVGFVTVIGFLTASEGSDIIPSLLFGAKTIRGVLNTSVEMIQRVAKEYEEGGMRPAVASVYEWKDAKDAFKELNAQSGVGKIVIKVGEN